MRLVIDWKELKRTATSVAVAVVGKIACVVLLVLFRGPVVRFDRPTDPERNPGISPGETGKPPGFRPPAADNPRPGL